VKLKKEKKRKKYNRNGICELSYNFFSLKLENISVKMLKKIEKFHYNFIVSFLKFWMNNFN
jgi:hypothetical protein